MQGRCGSSGYITFISQNLRKVICEMQKKLIYNHFYLEL